MSDRRILAAVHRHARQAGWRSQWSGWTNGAGSDATVRVSWAEGVVQVSRKDRGQWPVWPTEYRVDTVRQAVDLLVAIGVLPVGFSSAYEAGRYDWRGENAELRRDLDWRMHMAATACRDREVAQRRAQSAERERDEAERRLRAVRMVKVWRNEDGKNFVFADELWAATDPDIAARLTEATP